MGTMKKAGGGGSLSGLKASNKRVGPIDPKGAWTKVQEKTLAGAKGKAIRCYKNEEKEIMAAAKKNWIQDAVNPAHKGYCTPMTKATCTPKRKALAKTFKAMGRARKGK